MKTAAFLLLLISGQAIVNIAFGQGCTKECFAGTFLDCPTFVDYDHCQNCCTINPSDCSLRYTSDGSVACKGEGGLCPQFCLPDSVLLCGDVVDADHCQNCCTVAFTNCALLMKNNGTIICQGIGFKPRNIKMA